MAQNPAAVASAAAAAAVNTALGTSGAALTQPATQAPVVVQVFNDSDHKGHHTVDTNVRGPAPAPVHVRTQQEAIQETVAANAALPDVTPAMLACAAGVAKQLNPDPVVMPITANTNTAAAPVPGAPAAAVPGVPAVPNVSGVPQLPIEVLTGMKPVQYDVVDDNPSVNKPHIVHGYDIQKYADPPVPQICQWLEQMYSQGLKTGHGVRYTHSASGWRVDTQNSQNNFMVAYFAGNNRIVSLVYYYELTPGMTATYIQTFYDGVPYVGYRYEPSGTTNNCWQFVGKKVIHVKPHTG